MKNLFEVVSYDSQVRVGKTYIIVDCFDIISNEINNKRLFGENSNIFVNQYGFIFEQFTCSEIEKNKNIKLLFSFGISLN